MRELITVFIFAWAASMPAWGMIPLEGLVFGDVKDIPQYDPMDDVFTYQKELEQSGMGESWPLFKSYIGLTNQGLSLKNSCQFYSYYKYETPWQEHNARRAIAATLQYIGIDLTMKAIIQYAKLFEFSDEEFANLVNNLVVNNCSPNISIYSHKKIKDNFFERYNNPEKYSMDLPIIKEGPLFNKATATLTGSIETRQREFELTVKSFRSFCSWGGDAHDYRMLVPYLTNPYVMSMVFNNLLGRKMSYDPALGGVVFRPSDKTVKVACQNYLCRKVDDDKFKVLYPRMIGATNLYVDFESLYCGHFRNLTYQIKDQNPTVREWIREQSIDDPDMEVLNFTSLVTGHSELLVSAEKFTDIRKIIGDAIVGRFDEWANRKSDQVVFDLLYEEAMHIDLTSSIGSYENQIGEFQLQFVYSLGEMDRVLGVADKIHAQIELNFPRSYLRWVKNYKRELENEGNYLDEKALKDRVAEYINLQLAEKRKDLLLPLWNDQMGDIMAKELLGQLDFYAGSALKSFKHDTIKVPVKFYFGLFALQYINRKFKEKIKSKPLTFGEKVSSLGHE